MDERFFGLITEKQIRCGVFTAVAELESAIHDFIEAHKADSKPFILTKTANEILAKVIRLAGNR